MAVFVFYKKIHIEQYNFLTVILKAVIFVTKKKKICLINMQ